MARNSLGHETATIVQPTEALAYRETNGSVNQCGKMKYVSWVVEHQVKVNGLCRSASEAYFLPPLMS
jgi:hypothetical protein